MEHRKNDRTKLVVGVFFKMGISGNFQGRVVDISLGGLYLRAEKKFRSGRNALVYLPIQEGSREKMCFLSGRIVHTRDHPDEGEMGYGIEFDPTMSYSTKKSLENFITKKLESTKTALDREKSQEEI